MKPYAFFLLLFIPALAYANPKAEKLIRSFFSEPVLTDTYVTGFVQNRSEAMKKIYLASSGEVHELVKVNYTEPVIKDAVKIIADHIKDPEIEQITKFFSTPAGKKAKEILLKKPTKKVTEILTREELATIDSFYKSYAGLMWDTALKKIVSGMKDPNSKRAQQTVKKLHAFFKEKETGYR